jgi:hypothetical protein
MAAGGIQAHNLSPTLRKQRQMTKRANKTCHAAQPLLLVTPPSLDERLPIAYLCL